MYARGMACYSRASAWSFQRPTVRCSPGCLPASGGVDPYGGAASDVYQDLFHEGIFTGKGILDVAACQACLHGRLPEGKILSHDLLEGSYLRAGFLSDVELSDGYPYKVIAYFDRLHRWIRGDWQILRWLRGTVPTPYGVERNPIGKTSKFKIFENLRRSATSILIFLSMLLSVLIPTRGLVTAGIIGLLALAANLLLSFAAELGRGGGEFRTRYNSTIIYGVKGACMQTLIQLAALPHEAALTANAICLALWRMLVSKRNLLSWVTAAEAEGAQRKGLSASYRRMWAAPAAGALALVFSRSLAGWLLGMLWILTPWIAEGLSRPKREKKGLSAEDRAFLLEQARRMWRYFEDFVNPEENFLPPDNWQEQHANGLASRTSPTNIGLGLLVALGAKDLELISEERAYALIENILDSIERLDKWNGHLLNWYDTKTREPLCPCWVSTVDSGNLAVCLTALKAGLDGRGDLREKADALLRAMDFAPLYDPGRKLFYIGYDVDNQKPTDGWYDLMESEARQTSFYAVAKGIVPKEHWARLGRSLVSSGKYAGMASWTGTMFEYLMPNLLMPCYENSAIDESSRFALYCQKERTRGKRAPWGISESAFFAFDPDMNYQYKAHGVQKLGLKRGLDNELVISPYSSFLALGLAPEEAVANLRRLEELGLAGRYGLYEAADYTRTRGAEFSAVKTFMVHHLGMSFLATVNALCEDIFVKRFLEDAEISAFRELLQEKVPVNPVVMDVRARQVPAKPNNRGAQVWSSARQGYHVWQPRCTVLSNGKYRVLVTDTGITSSSSGKLQMDRFDGRQVAGAQGMSFFLRDQAVYSLTPAPYFDSGAEYTASLGGDTAAISAQKGGVSSKIEIRVPGMENAEVRTVILENTDEVAKDLELAVYLEPVLAPRAEYHAHPAFSKLFLETEILGQTVVIRRRPRSGKQYRYLAFRCDQGDVRYDTSKEQALGRGGIHALAAALENPAGQSQGAVLDPCILGRIRMILQPGEKRQFRFSMACGDSREQAVETAERVLSAELPGTSMVDALAERFELTPGQVSESMAILCELVFLTGARRAQGQAIKENRKGQQALWKYAISGDLPLITARFTQAEELKEIQKLIREFCLISGLGIRADLILLLGDRGDYRRPLHNAIMDTVKKLGLENRLNKPGGIYVLDLSACAEEEGLLEARSAVVFTPGQERATPALPALPVNRLLARSVMRACAPRVTYWPDGSVEIDTAGGLPAVAWSNILANPDMGFVATDAGSGHLWAKNARENPITPWENDPLAVTGPETLTCHGFSLFAALDGAPCKVRFAPGSAEWEKQIGEDTVRVRAFVPAEKNARIYLLESTAPVEIEYFVDLDLGARDQVVTFFDDENQMICATNHWNRDFAPQVFGVMPRGEELRFTCDASQWYADDLDAATGGGLIPCIGLKLRLERKEDRFTGALICAWGQDTQEWSSWKDEDLEALLEQTRADWRRLTRPVAVDTPDVALNTYLNGWALYQTAACRLFGRSSIYQSGGAYGFRDQLQDACAFAAYRPELLRAQILRAAAHQYVEGDVQHWWHESLEGADKGVRTRISDDLLWLPYAVCEYVEKTGDQSLLDASAPFLLSTPLSDRESERYETPQLAEESGTILDHCIRAVERVLARGSGERGLALFGGGDWNDGMNLVGAGGRGESVWLTWFAALVLRRFSNLCRDLDRTLSERCEQAALKWIQAASDAWDGEWFLRGTYDDGSLLGSHTSEECRIDSIAQSFSAFFEECPPNRRDAALQAALDQLVDDDARLVRLFDPAFDKSEQKPGYIKGYLAGIRENGGQYTHGAVWLAMACLMRGRADDGYRILSMLLPETHDTRIYKAEPYVLAGDVYANPDHMGRGGWSWYTGSAAWYWRVAIENLLGLRIRDSRLFVEPHLPMSWDGFEAMITIGKSEYRVSVRKGSSSGMKLDGAPAEDGVLLKDDGASHQIEAIVADS